MAGTDSEKGCLPSLWPASHPTGSPRHFRVSLAGGKGLGQGSGLEVAMV